MYNLQKRRILVYGVSSCVIGTICQGNPIQAKKQYLQ